MGRKLKDAKVESHAAFHSLSYPLTHSHSPSPTSPTPSSDKGKVLGNSASEERKISGGATLTTGTLDTDLKHVVEAGIRRRDPILNS